MWEVIKHARIECHDCQCMTTVADMGTIYLGYTFELGGEEIQATAFACKSCQWDRWEVEYD